MCGGLHMQLGYHPHSCAHGWPAVWPPRPRGVTTGRAQPQLSPHIPSELDPEVGSHVPVASHTAVENRSQQHWLFWAAARITLKL